MIIPINIEPSHTNSKLPSGLARISHDEVVLIELQGALEVESADPAARNGKFVGTLRIDDNTQKPTLVIGHHLLEGKITALAKPVAVLYRTTSARPAAGGDGGSPNANPRRGTDRFSNNASEAIPHIAAGPEIGTSAAAGRIPTTTLSSSSASARAANGKGVLKGGAGQADMHMGVSRSGAGEADGGGEREYGDAMDVDGKGLAAAASSQPSQPSRHGVQLEDVEIGSSWDVVAVVKRKILFSKRPMPIVGRHG